MVEQSASGGDRSWPAGPGLAESGVELLAAAMERLLAEDPAALAPAQALARTAALLTGREQLAAAAVSAVRDVDVRELYCLEQAGSTRSWLRRQLGGDSGQLALARHLLNRPVVAGAFAAGRLAQRAASQLCLMLTDVPATVSEPRMIGVLADGVRSLLAGVTGRTGLTDDQLPAATRAVRADVEHVLTACLGRVDASPVDRLEPAVLLLARYLPAGQLSWALKVLADALDPAEAPHPLGSRFYLELVPVMDGEWDLRGHLNPETGALLAAELDRQERIAQTAAATATRTEATPDRTDAGGEAADLQLGIDDLDGGGRDAAAEAAGATDLAQTTAQAAAAADAAFFTGLSGPRDEHQSSSALRLTMRRARRHAGLGQLLRDAASHTAGNGQPAPAVLLLTASIDQLEGRPGAPPALLHTPGAPVPIPRQTLQRLGCHSELNMVVLDALGRPVGASTTLRSASRRQRHALTAVWGAWCAIAGCTQTATVPHHVRPWWQTQQTVLRDLIPICEHDHHDLHEGHRTLRLEDGRHIDEHGWTSLI